MIFWAVLLGLFLPLVWFRLGLFIMSGYEALGIAFFLIILTVHYHFKIPALDAFTFTFLAVTGAKLFFKFYQESSVKKNKFLVGTVFLKLIGEAGVVTKDFGVAQTGLVRMENPVYQNEEMECIADDAMKAGEAIKVIKVDCGLLKVARTSPGNAPADL